MKIGDRIIITDPRGNEAYYNTGDKGEIEKQTGDGEYMVLFNSCKDRVSGDRSWFVQRESMKKLED